MDKVLKYKIKLVIFKLNILFKYHNIEQSQKKLVNYTALFYQEYK